MAAIEAGRAVAFPFMLTVASLPGRHPGIRGAVLAHQGGWDEILLVAGPIAVIVGLLLLARKRVGR